MDMKNKCVVITGASRGIGEAAAKMFALNGANVVLLARGGDRITQIAAQIGPQALAVPCDVADWAQVEAAIDRAARHFGGIDVLINNAGVIEPIGPLASSDPGAWGRVIDINLKGVYHGIRAALPHMHKVGGGTILTLSSGAATHPLEGWAHYCASKAGARMLNACLHLEEAGRGIRAMALSPGTVATQMQHEIRASGINSVAALDWSDHIPPEWAAQALMWMCTGDADEFLGQEVSLRDTAIRARVGLVR
ncbi:MAG TPA: SDR family oxidoreductase [Aliiroseovarius sp.]|nr:SDR family oxidoreductase [Aliiroseovarius sp.]